ncbi:MAG: class I SAM-dependent methyltransferase [Nocardioides sp.]|nr:class I SAM-dependent methyltransferase [Nocardioides sp.]
MASPFGRLLAVDIPRIFTIRESTHRIHNPFTPVQLAAAALGEGLRLTPGAVVLDLASGSGEMLCTWARDHGIGGTGVDLSRVFTQQARSRAAELGVVLLRSLRPGALMLVGEPHWRHEPPDQDTVEACHATSRDDFRLSSPPNRPGTRGTPVSTSAGASSR